jgi:hypothetical protein
LAVGVVLGAMEMAQQTKRVNLSRLPPERKQAAWAWLKTNRPAEAKLIQSDDVKSLIAAFNGEIILEIEVNEKN